MKKFLVLLILAPMLGLGAWTVPDTYTVNLVYYETPESVKYTFRFEDSKLLCDTERKASFGPRKPQ